MPHPIKNCLQKLAIPQRELADFLGIPFSSLTMAVSRRTNLPDGADALLYFMEQQLDTLDEAALQNADLEQRQQYAAEEAKAGNREQVKAALELYRLTQRLSSMQQKYAQALKTRQMVAAVQQRLPAGLPQADLKAAWLRMQALKAEVTLSTCAVWRQKMLQADIAACEARLKVWGGEGV